MNTEITTEKWKKKAMNEKITMIVFCFFAICLYGMTRFIDRRDLMARLQKLETMESETVAKLEKMADKAAFGFKTRADFDRAVIATLQRSPSNDAMNALLKPMRGRPRRRKPCPIRQCTSTGTHKRERP